MSHVFVSYVREDTDSVVELCNDLRQNGAKVWFDQNDILPGMRWKQEIRNAIRKGEFFIACFSPNYVKRGATYMNEELILAIDLLRQKPADRAWFIPVVLSPCDLPDREIGGGETLLDLQQVRLYQDRTEGLRRILSVIKPGDLNLKPTTKAKAPITVLFLADSTDGAQLRVAREFREIQIQMRRSRVSDFHMEVHSIATPDDLIMAILEVKPMILHFAGRGDPSGTLMLQDSRGGIRPLNMQALASLLGLADPRVECVIFNRFFSLGMAEALAGQANYVIGFRDTTSDEESIQFSRSFYEAIGEERSVEFAFRIGTAAMKLLGSSEVSMPVLVRNPAPATSRLA